MSRLRAEVDAFIKMVEDTLSAPSTTMTTMHQRTARLFARAWAQAFKNAILVDDRDRISNKD